MTLQGCYMILRWFEEDQRDWHILQHEILGIHLALLLLFGTVFLNHIFLPCMFCILQHEAISTTLCSFGWTTGRPLVQKRGDGRELFVTNRLSRDVWICAHDSTEIFLEWWSGLGRNRRSKRHQDAYQDTWHVGLCGRHAWIRLQTNGSSFWHLLPVTGVPTRTPVLLWQLPCDVSRRSASRFGHITRLKTPQNPSNIPSLVVWE